MHGIENVFLLTLYDYTDFFAECIKFIGNGTEFLGGIVHIHNHHHVEKIRNDGLGNVKDIDVVVGKIGAGLGNDSYGIFTYYGDNGFIHEFSFCLKRRIIDYYGLYFNRLKRAISFCNKNGEIIALIFIVGCLYFKSDGFVSKFGEVVLTA